MKAIIGRWYAVDKAYGKLWAPDKNGKWRHLDIKGDYAEYLMVLILGVDRQDNKKIFCVRWDIPYATNNTKVMPHPLPWLPGPTGGLKIGWQYHDAYFNERSDPLLMPENFKPSQKVADIWKYKVIKHIMRRSKG
jgi:hypothetical protein